MRLIATTSPDVLLTALTTEPLRQGSRGRRWVGQRSREARAPACAGQTPRPQGCCVRIGAPGAPSLRCRPSMRTFVPAQRGSAVGAAAGVADPRAAAAHNGPRIAQRRRLNDNRQ
eukprot:scaffold11839_cov124-Isochrysis_galbana.AAC.7